jgi:hypothetical protein
MQKYILGFRNNETKYVNRINAEPNRRNQFFNIRPNINIIFEEKRKDRPSL